jgi:hypothetical protein
MDSSAMGFFFLLVGFIIAVFGAYTGISGCYRLFAALYQR